MLDLDELERRAMMATPGPWTHSVKCGFSHSILSEPRMDVAIAKGSTGHGEWIAQVYDAFSTPEGRENADFIAASNPAAILELIARLRKAEARL